MHEVTEQDALTEEEFLAAEAKRQADDAARAARFVEWLAGQPESFQALAAEWFALQEARKMPHGFNARILRNERGRLVYEVSCANGVHQSYESHEHALELLVDAHRTRIEDLETTHEQARAILRRTAAGRHAINDARHEVARRRTQSQKPPLAQQVLDDSAEIMAARARCAELGRKIREKHPELSGPERDELVLEALSVEAADADAEEAARLASEAEVEVEERSRD